VIKQLKAGWSARTKSRVACNTHDQPLRCQSRDDLAYVYATRIGQSENSRVTFPPSERAKKRLHDADATTPRGPCLFRRDRSIHIDLDYVKTGETFGQWKVHLMYFERAQGKTNVASLVDGRRAFAVLISP